ncbi:MAG: type III-B CRISPR module RAMP protein Cmr6 [Desulfotignum sp.]|nr:type III-B CRISPR module RAMP protein Cmr6 [Desulfotignum sp.]
MGLEKRDDPPDVLFPVPAYQQNYFGSVSNFGLFFQKFNRYQWLKKAQGIDLKAQHSWNNNKRGRDRTDYEWSILENQTAHAVVMKNAGAMLEKFHEQQIACLESFSELEAGILEISARSATHLLTGIGESTPTEVGMVFHRNMGIPYMPASSLKGAIRYAYCINFAQANPEKVSKGMIEESDVPGLRELFGSSDAKKAFRGGFAFMDCCADQVPTLKKDIMNPHFGKYYQNSHERGPEEIESPVPIKFLVVEKGLTYRFRGFFLNPEARKFEELLIQAIKTALTVLGIGAKTAVGYGRFDNIEVTTDSIIKSIRDKKRLEQECRIMAAQEKKKADEQARRDALEEKKKAEQEARKQQIAEQKEAEEQALKSAIDNAPEGIEKDLLLFQKNPQEQMAVDLYDTYLNSLSTLNEKQRDLAIQLDGYLKKLWSKKTKKNKLKRHAHIKKLLKT